LAVAGDQEGVATWKAIAERLNGLAIGRRCGWSL
jgi:hypothetical protein